MKKGEAKQAMEPAPEPASDMWTEYSVSLKILNRIYGGIPKNPELIEGFLKGKGVPAMAVAELAPKIAASIDPEEAEAARTAEAMWTGFKSDDRGIYIETRQIKAMLKEASGESEMWRDIRGLKSRLGGAVFPKAEGGSDFSRIYLYRDGKPLGKPDAFEDTVGHVSGPAGPRSILKRKDYAENVVMSFKLKVGSRTVTEEVLRNLFEFGSELGLGADRSQENGKFEVMEFAKKA